MVAHITPLCLLCLLQEYVQCVGKKCWTPKTTSRRLCDTVDQKRKINLNQPRHIFSMCHLRVWSHQQIQFNQL